MVTLIRQLIARGHAYEAGGEVLFDAAVDAATTARCRAARLDEQMIAGARVAVDAHKRDPADFVLWKQSIRRRAGRGTARGARSGPPGLAHRVLGDERGAISASRSTFTAAASI